MITVAASNVTVASLTLRRARSHPIHVVSTDGGDTLNALIYDLHILDPGQQSIKINPHAARIYYPDNGTVACSRIELTDAGRPRIWEINGSCYTGGVDGHQARGWTVRDNQIEGFWCERGLAEHGVHFWTGSRDTLVERNVLVDNARGIGFGLGEDDGGRTYDDDPCPGALAVGHYGGVVRNNWVFARRSELFSSEYGFDCGICLAQACGAQVPHNTVVSTAAPFSSIEWRFGDTEARILNNLVSHNLRDRGGTALLAGNLEGAPLSLFVDGAGGDLHLVSSVLAAIDRGVALSGGTCDEDIDGDARPIGAARDIGADEYGVAPPAAVTDLRVVGASSSGGMLTLTLRWTVPAGAETTALRYSRAPIAETNWESASLITDALPGSVGTYTVTVDDLGGTVYLALKTRNAEGAWSALSNNAFWPCQDLFMPVVVGAGCACYNRDTSGDLQRELQ